MDTMQALVSTRTSDTPTTLPAACRLSAAPAPPSLSTSKERDAESGNDYFGARYYASTMGRFLSPDWSSSPEAVPYADLTNPQSLNLYQYAGNNPLIRVDANGHCWAWIQSVCNVFQRSIDWVGGWGYATFSQVRARKREYVASQVSGPGDKDWVRNQATTSQINAAYAYFHDPNDQSNIDALAKVGIQIASGVVPQAALDTLSSIETTGKNLPNQAGGQPFQNRDGHLPTTDSNGNPITYREWDIEPSKFQGKPRSAERIVTGSDGSAWYTSDHYTTQGGWTRIK